jgi:large subunit ribosomal protein L15
MITLTSLKNTHRPKQKVQRVGRGMGSNRGKTCTRGGKGDSARTGYRCRFGHEGGQMRLYRKLPCRGFTNGRFANKVGAVTLTDIERAYKDGEHVNPATLREKGLVHRREAHCVKILSNGTLTKKVTIEAHAFSAAAKERLEKDKVSFKQL